MFCWYKGVVKQIVHRDICVPSKRTFRGIYSVGYNNLYLLVFHRRRSEHDGRHAFYFLDGGKIKLFCIGGSGKSTGFIFIAACAVVV